MNHPHHKAVTNQLRRMTDLMKEPMTNAPRSITEPPTIPTVIIGAGYDATLSKIQELEKQLLEAQAQVEVMRAALQSNMPTLQEYAVNNPKHVYRDTLQDPNGVHAAIEWSNKALAIPSSEALQQRDYEQRALALDYAASTLPHGDISNWLMRMAQEWRNKK